MFMYVMIVTAITFMLCLYVGKLKKQTASYFIREVGFEMQ